MKVKEIVRLADGREIVVNLSPEELTAVLSAGINFLIAQGMLALDSTDGSERIANEDVLIEMDASEQETPENTKH